MDDKAFILDPDKWPHWPVLPVKRIKDTQMDLGCLLDTGKIIVVLSNMWALKNTPISEQKSITYRTVDELLADGWRVD